MKTAKPARNRRKPKSVSGILDQEDRALWAHVTKSVAPLTNKQSQTNEPSRPIGPHDQPKILERAHQAPIVPDKITPTPLTYEHGQAPGLDKRTQMRLRRGQVVVEARLDLHGMTQAEAHDRLYQFLQAAYAHGKRSVLVITGKGLRRNGEIGVLRRAVPGWLNQPPVRDWIKAFDHAAPRDGGEGALYILLRRRK